MITIFNRKELLNTCSTERQSNVREVLTNNKIKYTVKVINRKSPSIFETGSRARTGTYGEHMDMMYEYIIYVKKEDYERACSLL